MLRDDAAEVVLTWKGLVTPDDCYTESYQDAKLLEGVFASIVVTASETSQRTRPDPI